MSNSLYHKLTYYKTTQKVNSFFYFLSHNFLFKKFFYDDLPKEYQSKEGIAKTFHVLRLLMSLTTKTIYILIITSLAMTLGLEDGFFMYFLELTVLGSLVKDIIKFNTDDFDAIILLKVDPLAYGRYLINTYLIREGILIFLAMTYCHMAIGIGYLQILVMTVDYLAIHLMGQGFSLMLFEKNGLKIKKSGVITLLCLIIMLAVTAFTVFSSAYFPDFIMYLVSLPIAIGGLASYLYICNFHNYTVLFKYNLSAILTDRKQNLTVIDGFDYQQVNKDIDSRQLNTKARGFEYLYQLFNSRYHKQLNKRYIFIMIFVTAACIGAVVISLFSPLGIESGRFAQLVFAGMNLIFYPMYFTCNQISKKYLQLCFFQLDRYLINYSFYRSRKAIMSSLRFRMKYLLARNLVIGILVSLTLGFVQIHPAGPSISEQLIVCTVLPIVLSVFFSIYPLAMYYLFQPYSFDGTVVNKIYPIVDNLVYGLAWFLLDFDITLSALVMIIITVVLAIVSVVLFILVNKLAPKLFRVR